MPVKRPLFIMVEGVDGSGKSTLCSQLKDYMSANGYQCEYVSAFGSGAVGSALRKVWLTPEQKPECSRITEFNVFLTAVTDAMTVAEQHLAAGKSVIMDRGYISTYVYQLLLNSDGYTHTQLVAAKRLLLTSVRYLMLKPDHTLYCHAPAETVKSNIANRGVLNHMDKLNTVTLLKCFNMALQTFRMEGNVIIEVDNSEPYPRDHTETFKQLLREHT